MDNSKNLKSKADKEKQIPPKIKFSKSFNFQKIQCDKSARNSTYRTEPKAGKPSGAEIVSSSPSPTPMKSYAAAAAVAASNVCHSFEHKYANENPAKNLNTHKIDKSMRDSSCIKKPIAGESSRAEIVASSPSAKPQKSYAAAKSNLSDSFEQMNINENPAENLNTHNSNAKNLSASSSNPTTNFTVHISREKIADALKQRYAMMYENPSSKNNSPIKLPENLLKGSRGSVETAFDNATNLFNNLNQATNSPIEEGSFASSEKFESRYQDSCWTDNSIRKLLYGVNENSSKKDINQVAMSLLKRVNETLKNITKLLYDMDEPLGRWFLKSSSYARHGANLRTQVEGHLKKNERSTLNNWQDIRFRLDKLSYFLARTVFFTKLEDYAVAAFCIRDMISIVVENDELMSMSNIFGNTLMPLNLGDDAKLFLDMKKQLAFIVTRLLSIASDVERLREITRTYSLLLNETKISKH